MKNLKQFLDKKEKEFSWTQIDLPHLLSKDIANWSKENIPDSQLSTKGREKESHVTVLFGLHDNTPFRVEKIINNTKTFEVELGEISVFTDNEKFNVLKISVFSEKLKELNEKLQKLPHTNKYEYNPHVTIAYIKKDGNWKWGNEKEFIGRKFKADEVVFINKNKRKTILLET